jgi:hypothetical protein
VDFHAREIKPRSAAPKQAAKAGWTRRRTAKKAWTSAANPINFEHLMKCDTMNSVLTFVLGAFVVLGVIFALRAISGQRDFRMLQYQASQSQAGLIQLQQLQALVNDIKEYDKLHPSPELTHILDGLQTKPATR